MTKLFDLTLTAARSDIIVSRISQSYLHLYVTAMSRDTGTGDGTLSHCWTQFNGDTGSNYSIQEFRGVLGATVDAVELLAQGFGIPVCAQSISTSVANGAGSGWMLIPNYSRQDYKKAVVSQFAVQFGTDDMGIVLCGGYWNNTAAIHTIRFESQGGAFAAGSRICIYGVP